MSVDQRSNEDPLLDALGKLARADEQPEGDQARLEALVRGELPHDEASALEQRASADPALQQALEAYRPFDQAARERIAQQIAHDLFGENAAEPSATLQKQVVDLASHRQRRRRRATRLSWIALPLAAAAALVLWLALPGRGPATLPDYTLEPTGGIQALRGTQQATEVVRLKPDSRLTLTLRPTTGVEGPVEARAFIVVGQKRRPVDFETKVAPSGAMQLSGTAEDLFGEQRGEHVLEVLVARPDALQDALDGQRTGDDGRGWQSLTLRVQLL
jgi:hypothetical protein